VVLAANKSDLYEFEEISDKEAREFAEEVNCLFKKTSAMNANGIDVSNL